MSELGEKRNRKGTTQEIRNTAWFLALTCMERGGDDWDASGVLGVSALQEPGKEPAGRAGRCKLNVRHDRRPGPDETPRSAGAMPAVTATTATKLRHRDLWPPHTALSL